MATERENRNCEHSTSFPSQAYFHSLLSLTNGDSAERRISRHFGPMKKRKIGQGKCLEYHAHIKFKMAALHAIRFL